MSMILPVMRIAGAAVLFGIVAAPAHAVDSPGHSPQLACVNKQAQRDAVASRQVVSLEHAIHTIRPKNKGEVVSARLCKGPNGLVYLLTLLSRNGKVTRATVDAANGIVLGGG